MRDFHYNEKNYHTNFLKFSASNSKLIIHNGYYIAEICQFQNCAIEGNQDVYVGETSDDQECAQMVKKKAPNALGATRYSSNECYAGYGLDISDSSDDRCCLFFIPNGNASPYLQIFIIGTLIKLSNNDKIITFHFCNVFGISII